MITNLERKVVLGGRPGDWPLERILSMKLLLALLGGTVGLLRFLNGATGGDVMYLGLFVVGGFMLPDLVLRQLGDRRQEAIQLQLPDTLDQMTVCVEAGLGFEAAMARAGRAGRGPLADELVRTLQEMQVGVARSVALKSLAARTEVQELRRFVLALVQAEQYGLPMAEVLRTQAADLRVRRRQRAEERAMKIPVKVLFPLMICILPTLFIVLIGPAALTFMRSAASF